CASCGRETRQPNRVRRTDGTPRPTAKELIPSYILSSWTQILPLCGVYAALIALLVAGVGSAKAGAQRAVGHVAQVPSATQSAGTAPEVRIEFFGAERGYAIGGQNVTLLCILRNVGT